MSVTRRVLFALMLSFIPVADAHAQLQDIPHWTFEITPYGWLAGLDGTVGARNRSVGVDIGFSKVLKNLDGAFMFAGGVGHGRWTLGYEMIYVKLSHATGTPGPLFSSANAGAKQLLIGVTPQYRISGDGPIKVDLFAGGRFWKLKNTVTLEPGLLSEKEFSDTQKWFDPIIGASGVADIGNWLVQGRVDLGGFTVGSSGTAQALGAVGYRISKVVAVKAGYRALFVDYANNSKGFMYSVNQAGWITGVAFTF